MNQTRRGGRGEAYIVGSAVAEDGPFRPARGDLSGLESTETGPGMRRAGYSRIIDRPGSTFRFDPCGPARGGRLVLEYSAQTSPTAFVCPPRPYRQAIQRERSLRLQRVDVGRSFAAPARDRTQ
jgi:hypothetical protein